MSLPVSNGTQAPLNLILPFSNRAGLNIVKLISWIKTRALIEATEQVGTVHFLRLVDLKEDNKLAFFTSYDGEFRKYIQDFIRCLAPVFDAVFRFVSGAPTLPVAKNADEFIDWIEAHNLDAIGFYSAYPSLTVQDVRARIAAAPATGKIVQSPLTLKLPLKTPADSVALAQLLPTAMPKLFDAAESVGSLHFARFIPLNPTRLLFVSDYDGDLGEHIRVFAKNLGPVFDAVLEHVVGAPPLPVQNNVDAFVEWVAARNLPPSLYYSAHPALTVPTIRARAMAA